MDPQRLERLEAVLGLPQIDLPTVDKQQLRDLVHGYADVFAHDESELRSTNWVTHSKQQPANSPTAPVYSMRSGGDGAEDASTRGHSTLS